jgi:MarR-like DNA-binding transcriptional regulator SgrR of sgrS sRNA
MMQTARAETRPAYGGALQAALSSAPIALDPQSGEPGDLEAASLVFDPIYRLEGGKPRPHLATLEGNRLVVRTDVKFHDGTPLRAGDVANALSRAMRGWTVAPISAVRAISDDTVELTLARPAPDLPLLLTTVLVAKGKIGTGPFSVEKIDAESVALKAFGEHFAGRPYLDQLLLHSFPSRSDEAGAYETGALQVSRHGTSNFGRHVADNTDGPTSIVIFLAIGPSVPPALAGPLQAALAAGLDRERLRRIVGAPAQLVPAPALTRTSLPPPRPHLSLLVDNSRFEHRALADRLLAELSRIGVDASIELVDAGTYHARREGNHYELLLGDALAPAPELTELALLGAVDPALARTLLARAPAVPSLKLERILPLVRRGARLSHPADLRGLTVDGCGRGSFADVHWKGRSAQ